MIAQLLDLTQARLTAGIPVTLSADPIDLASVVAKIVDEVRAAHPDASIDLRAEADCAAQIDPDRFEQVVSNLLENAVTHGDRTRPIEVVLARQRQTVSMTVHNHGRPFAADSLPLLFSPFTRGDKPQEGSAGLGLGLYVSERIVDALHGKLSVQSSSDAGTTFEAILPRRSA